MSANALTTGGAIGHTGSAAEKNGCRDWRPECQGGYTAPLFKSGGFFVSVIRRSPALCWGGAGWGASARRFLDPVRQPIQWPPFLFGVNGAVNIHSMSRRTL